MWIRRPFAWVVVGVAHVIVSVWTRRDAFWAQCSVILGPQEYVEVQVLGLWTLPFP